LEFVRYRLDGDSPYAEYLPAWFWQYVNPETQKALEKQTITSRAALSWVGDMATIYNSANKSRVSSKHSSRKSWSNSRDSQRSGSSSKRGGKGIRPRDFKSG